jgi:hypothetical protein
MQRANQGVEEGMRLPTEVVEGIAQIRQGLVAYRDLGMAMEDPYFLALLAAAYVSAGQVQDGKAALDDALTRLPGERDVRLIRRCHGA